MEKRLKNLKIALVIVITDLIITMFMYLSSLTTVSIVARVVLIMMAIFCFLKVNSADDSAAVSLIIFSIIFLILACINPDFIVLTVSGYFLLESIKLYLEENTYLYENILIKILVNVIGIIVILFIAYQAININYGLNQSIETGIKKFNEIELGDSLDDVKKIANRSIEGEENTYSGLTTITFNINAMKEYSIKVVFQHEDKNDSSSKLVCVSRKLDCDEDVLADKNVSFDNFETLKEKCEKASYDYYFSSSDLLKTYKSYSDYHEENKVTLDDVSEYLLSDGILKEEESWTNTKTTVFADSDGNYISVTSTDSVVSKIEGKVNGEKISVSAHY